MAKLLKIQLSVLLFFVILFIVSCGGGGNGGGNGSPTPNNGNGNGGGDPNLNFTNVTGLYDTNNPDDTGTPDDTGGNGNTNNPSNIQLTEGGRASGFRVDVNGGTNIVHVLNNETNSPVWSQRFKLNDSHFSNTTEVDDRNYNTGRIAYVRDGNIVLAENIGQIIGRKGGDILLTEYVDNDSNVYFLEVLHNTGETIIHPDGIQVVQYNTDIEVGGSELTGMPSGILQYNGEMFISPRKRGTFSDELDYFTIEANFDNFTGNISTSHNVLTGNFEINSSSGTYFGNELRMTYIFPDFGINIRNELATIYGAFHNEGATGVSGIFFDNTEQRFGGAIIGARTTLR